MCIRDRSHIDQYLNNNISDANSWLNVTDTALENMKTILTDVSSLCAVSYTHLANKVLVDKYNTQMTTQKKINKPSDLSLIHI